VKKTSLLIGPRGDICGFDWSSLISQSALLYDTTAGTLTDTDRDRLCACMY